MAEDHNQMVADEGQSEGDIEYVDDDLRRP